MVVDDGFGERVVIEGVDGEIPPDGVFGLGTVAVVGEHSPVLVSLDGLAGSEGGNLDGFQPVHDVDDLEPSANDARAAKKRPNFLGRGIGGDIVILGQVSDQQVADCAADDVSLVTVILEHSADLDRPGGDLSAVDAMLADRDASRFGGSGKGRYAMAKNSAQQLANHLNDILEKEGNRKG